MVPTFLDESMESLVGETFNMVLLDSGCTKTVCGELWLQIYLDTLKGEDFSKVLKEESHTKFKFGDNKMIKSIRKVTFPAVIANTKVSLSTDVVDYNIPLLLSKESMKKAGVQIDFGEDKVVMFDQRVDIKYSSCGHYCVPINGNKLNDTVELSLFCGILNEKSDKEIMDLAKKLHRQFAHPTSKKLKSLIDDAEVNNVILNKCIDEVSEKCDTCIKYKRPKRRPVVAFPLAKIFNDTVAMDLKQYSYSPNIWILHIIDHATRYSVSCVIKTKRKEEIVKQLFKHWVSVFGYAKRFLVDNGVEFNNSEFITFCENLNIKVCTTAAESPWSNGLVERHNAILGLTVSKVMEDTTCDIEIALAWAICAKNTIKNVCGFSPNQLVFGMNPNLPNALDNKLPALEGRTSSKIVSDNLNAMHSARQQFLKNQASEKLMRALRAQTRTYADTKYFNGDSVYFKREGRDAWHGPGSVIGQDGQQVLVKHGSTFVRVHPCNLQLVNNTQMTDDKISKDDKTIENTASTISDMDTPGDLKAEVPVEISDTSDEEENIIANTEDDVANVEDNSSVDVDTDNYSNEADQTINFMSEENIVTGPVDDDNVGVDNFPIFEFDNASRPKLLQYASYKKNDSDDWNDVQVISRKKEW